MTVSPAAGRIWRRVRACATFPSRDSRLQPFRFPEVQLMSVLIVAVKASQSFDSVECRPRSESEPAALAIDWTIWQPALRTTDPAPDQFSSRRNMFVSEKDVFDMSQAQLDQYLDWHQRMWINESQAKCKHLRISYHSLLTIT